jgi:hypothetical protein
MDTDPLTRDRGNPHDAAPPKGFWIKLPCDQHGGHKGRFNLECPACNSKNASWAPYPQPAPPAPGPGTLDREELKRLAYLVRTHGNENAHPGDAAIYCKLCDLLAARQKGEE